MWGMALAAVMMVSVASAQTVEEVGMKMKEAGELINAKKITEAIPVLEQVIKMGTEVGADAVDITGQAQKLLPKLYLQQGVTQVQAKQMDAAIASLLKAENLADMQGDVMTVRQAGRFVSNIYMAQGIESFNAKDYTKALESFQKGMKQDPDNIQLAYFTAKSYAEMGRLDQAVELYKQVIAAGTANSKFEKQATDAKTDMNTYMLIAASEAAKAGNLDELQKYAEAIPDNADAGLLVVQVANNQKKYDVVIAKGAEAYAVQTDPGKKSEVAYLLGVAYQNKSNNAKAAEWLRKVTAGSNVAAAKALLTEVTAAQ